MHGNPGRLIDDQQGFVFKQDRQLSLDFCAGDNLFALCNTHGRNSQEIADLQTVGNPRAIHPNLPTEQC
jgi:hypothetical protein